MSGLSGGRSHPDMVNSDATAKKVSGPARRIGSRRLLAPCPLPPVNIHRIVVLQVRILERELTDVAIKVREDHDFIARHQALKHFAPSVFEDGADSNVPQPRASILDAEHHGLAVLFNQSRRWYPCGLAIADAQPGESTDARFEPVAWIPDFDQHRQHAEIAFHF